MGEVKRTILAALLIAAAGIAFGPLTQAFFAADSELDRKIERLIKRLGDDRFRIREAAARELVAIGRPAIPALRGVLKSPDPDLRLRARNILNQIQNSITGLIEDLADKDPKVRREAAEQLGLHGAKAKAAIPALVKALKDGDESVREAAIAALEVIDPANKALAGVIPAKAHVNGKYGRLLRKIKVPQDRKSYGDFTDFGHYQATDWAGHKNIPAGYWVYVHPHWYIWGDLKK
jgi:hypothetical protein